MLALSVHFNWKIVQLDVKTAFLNGHLDETIYMFQPPGFIDKNRPEDICLLRRSLYRLKQAPRQWNKRFKEFMLSNGFKYNQLDNCLFYRGI